MLLPGPPGDLFTSADATRHGATQRQLEWAVRTGELHRVRPGVLCRAATWAAADPLARAVLTARAVALSHRSSIPYAFSHLTAAALLDLPVPPAGSEVWLTVGPGGSTRRRRGVVQQVASLPPRDVTLVQGLPCTTPARTVVDCLRHLPPPEAVAVGDAALRSGRVTREDLARAVEQAAGRPRVAAAAALLPLLDGQRESPLESRSAFVMHAYGLPAPQLQVRILDQRGRVVARVDFAWLRHGVVGEADGLVKYADRGARGIADEKEREARLLALGLVVVRWTEQQLHGDPPLLVQQLRVALANGDGRRFRGRAA